MMFWIGFGMGAVLVAIISLIILQKYKDRIEYLQDMLWLESDNDD